LKAYLGLCYGCKAELLDHQIVETDLNISASSKKLMLSGYDPKTILDVAKSALSFWNHQKKHEFLRQQREAEHYHVKSRTQAKQIEEKDSRINQLKADLAKALNEKLALKAELATMADQQMKKGKKRTSEDFF
jgi:predicted RNase H-like nuclease (RuvC/YqgF family)